MKLLQDIIDAAVSEQEPLSTLLRRCLVLEFKLHNRKLEVWVNNELDGYGSDAEVPDYRCGNSISRGHFIGPNGLSMRNRTLHLQVMDPQHQSLVDKLELRQPISAYESVDANKEARIPWNPDLTVEYQDSFITDHSLVQAWQDIPHSLIVTLVDSVRTRVLRFALEIQKELGDVEDKVEKLSPAKVEQSVVNIIYGGNNVIASSAETISQIGSITVSQKDFAALTEALKTLGFGREDIELLRKALEADSKGQDSPTLGAKVKAWLGSIGGMVGKQGLTVAADVAQKVALKWLLQYLGLDPT
jgi:hypothetical protein